jgi:hypothetical protein
MLVIPGSADKTFADDVFKVHRVGEPAIVFSKMLRGDYGLTPKIAKRVVALMNESVANYRNQRNLPREPSRSLRAEDLFGPLYDFARHLIGALERTDVEMLTRTQQGLLDELAPNSRQTAKLVVKRFKTDKIFEGVEPSGGHGPVVFDPGTDLGQLSVQGLASAPVAAYTFFIRDPGPERWLWDFEWGETVFWIPSPFKPVAAGRTFNLMPSPQKVKPISGRFLVTAAVVLDKQALTKLDPHGTEANPRSLDENQTAKFLTEARRLAERPNTPVVIATSEYRVAQRGSVQVQI